MQPVTEQLRLPSSYGSPNRLLDWTSVEQRLVDSLHYWLATVRRDGSPHVVPVDGIWLDGGGYFGGDPATVHIRNLRRDSHATLHLEDGDSAVIVEGAAEWTTASASDPGLPRGANAQHTGTDAMHAYAGSALFQLSCLVQVVYARISERHDLTPVQARLLCTLAAGPKGMAELARCFGVEKAALTGLVDRVERRGLAKRSPVPGDRRALRVTPTDTGRRAAAAFHAEVNAELSHLLAPHDREQFCNTIAEILEQSGTWSRADSANG